MKQLFLILMLTYMLPAFSQEDTTYLYFDKNWKDCNKDTACYYGVVYKIDQLWRRKDFWVKGNILQMEGSYREQDCKTMHGIFNWYNQNSTLTKSAEYINGKVKTARFYYANGKRRAEIIYTAGGSVQMGWDENGQEIPGYIASKEARFPGGSEGWKEYLERKLDRNAASASKPGLYTVEVRFIVDPEGEVRDVRAVSVPEECLPCGEEAKRVIRKSPKWEPAIQFNKPVIYQAIQYVTFQGPATGIR